MNFKEAILCQTLVDWTYIAAVDGLHQKRWPGHPLSQRMEEVLQILGELAQDGLIEFGSLSGPKGGFAAWSLTTDESLALIRRRWRALAAPINLGDVGWIAATPEGIRLAESLPCEDA